MYYVDLIPHNMLPIKFLSYDFIRASNTCLDAMYDGHRKDTQNRAEKTGCIFISVGGQGILFSPVCVRWRTGRCIDTQTGLNLAMPPIIQNHTFLPVSSPSACICRRQYPNMLHEKMSLCRQPRAGIILAHYSR